MIPVNDEEEVFKKNSDSTPNDLDEVWEDYTQCMKEYKETILKLLSIRFGVSQKLKKDALPSITTVPDEAIQEGVIYDNFRVEEFDQTRRCVDLRRNYIPKL